MFLLYSYSNFTDSIETGIAIARCSIDENGYISIFDLMEHIKKETKRDVHYPNFIKNLKEYGWCYEALLKTYTIKSTLTGANIVLPNPVKIGTLKENDTKLYNILLATTGDKLTSLRCMNNILSTFKLSENEEEKKMDEKKTMNASELFECFKTLFPEWGVMAVSYKKIGKRALAISFENGLDGIKSSSRVFLYYNEDDWQFGTKLWRKIPDRVLEKKMRTSEKEDKQNVQEDGDQNE